MSFTPAAEMYRRCGRGRGMAVATTRSKTAGFTEQMGNPNLRVQIHEPPPAAGYQQVIDNHMATDKRCRTDMTGEKLRRVVRMIRHGYNKTEAAQAVGLRCQKSVSEWLKRLPPELAP